MRRPDPEPCGACAHGEWDICRNGGYTERGIEELHGFASELWTIPTLSSESASSSRDTCR
ncbi:hypothetical protein [Nocardioides massiliensis]|uniref:Threonine dehydrogenase-like Zn-dependent dehydrogenase n=1 Tax=Nocardioides massiliensis TaxID=1325935 RepID=A0ABT9NUW7_9ACTN|nr:hypothetical protein [Nocardioides massiliensis]MDP9824072.1 threonine dehydrogenase-like Zn-dependent dehydrogenase [Nocardioides massiliensis]